MMKIMKEARIIFLFILVFLLPFRALAVNPYDDVRNQNISTQWLPDELIRTLWFNQSTVFHPLNTAYAATVLDAGKNPGLGVRALHQSDIAGVGVSVAIIDQNLCLGHPEFAVRLCGYYDLGCDTPPGVGSMHGPAVASLLIGKNIGTAPGANLFYFAVPAWKLDAQYYADALYLLMKINEDSNLNIRVVSVSAAPSGPGSLFKNPDAWEDAVAAAEKQGIVVLDCTSHREKVIHPCYYDVADPEDVALVTIGFPKSGWGIPCLPGSICAPNSFRSQAEEMQCGQYGYQYMGEGGLSWSVPYVAGVMALGWQVNPELTGEQMWQLLIASALPKNGCRIIHPSAFIETVIASR